jgi:hypothetical protein
MNAPRPTEFKRDSLCQCDHWRTGHYARHSNYCGPILGVHKDCGCPSRAGACKTLGCRCADFKKAKDAI